MKLVICIVFIILRRGDVERKRRAETYMDYLGVLAMVCQFSNETVAALLWMGDVLIACKSWFARVARVEERRD